MTDKELQRRVMDSLTEGQRKVIAKIIRDAEVIGDYQHTGDGDDSFWQEDASATLKSIAAYFETYDRYSVLD